MSQNHIVIMAGGSGKRMGHELPKQLLTVGHAPMLIHLLDLSNRLRIDCTLILSKNNRETIIEFLIGRSNFCRVSDHIYSYRDIRVWIAVQEVANGTGGAVKTARDEVLRSKEYGMDPNIRHNILVLSADVPLLSERSAQTMLKALEDDLELKCIIYAQERTDPFGYGRIVTTLQGDLKIVEQKDIKSDEINNIKLINTGIYAFESEALFDALERINSNNAQNEYYLTSAPEIIQQRQKALGNTSNLCSPIQLYQNPGFDWDETMGANTPDQLESIKKEYLKKYQIKNLVTETMMTDEILRGYLICLEQLTTVDVDYNSSAALDRTRKFLNRYTEVNNKHVFVIFYDERVIGTISIAVEPKTIHGLSAVAHVEDVVIMSEFRRSGLGTRSLDFVKQFCQNYQSHYDLNIYKIILECSDDVLGFYQKNQYRYAGNSMRLDL